MIFNYQIIIEYDGTKFVGWQYQKNGISIQEILEKKLKKVLKERVRIIGAGRTDAGVHARQMFAHFNAIIEEGCLRDLVFLLNNYLHKLKYF